MARGVNKVLIIGNLGQDPEIRYLPSGEAIANLTVATSDTWKDKNTGQPQSRTEWHRVSFFGRPAEVIGEFARKGSKLYVEGSLRTRKYQAQDGSDRYVTEIVGKEFQFLDSKQDQEDGSSPHAPVNSQAAAMQSPPPDQFDDDIPF